MSDVEVLHLFIRNVFSSLSFIHFPLLLPFAALAPLAVSSRPSLIQTRRSPAHGRVPKCQPPRAGLRSSSWLLSCHSRMSLRKKIGEWCWYTSDEVKVHVVLLLLSNLTLSAVHSLEEIQMVPVSSTPAKVGLCLVTCSFPCHFLSFPRLFLMGVSNWSLLLVPGANHVQLRLKWLSRPLTMLNQGGLFPWCWRRSPILLRCGTLVFSPVSLSFSLSLFLFLSPSVFLSLSLSLFLSPYPKPFLSTTDLTSLALHKNGSIKMVPATFSTLFFPILRSYLLLVLTFTGRRKWHV